MMRNLIAVLSLALLSTCATAQGWANFKPGSYSKLKTTSNTDAAGMTIQTVTVMKQTLKEISPTEATVTMETESSTVLNGKETKMPVSTTEMKVPLVAASPAPEVVKAVASAQASVNTNVSTSTETLTVAGKALKCTVSNASVEAGGMKTVTKQWVSDDVPGAMVKSESSTSGASKSSMTMELLEFDAKR